MSELRLNTDGHIIKFGADNDVSLTHVADTGLLLNSTRKLQFNDASQFVQGSSATVLSIGATDEIDLTATEVEINVTTLDVNGAVALNGAVTGATNITLSGELDAATLDISGAIDIAGNSQFSGTVTVGVDDTGKDVKLFGATASSHLLWDESADTLNLVASTLGVGAVGTKDLGAGIHIKTSDTGGTVEVHADELVLENDNNCGMTILAGNDDASIINFGDDGDNNIGMISYTHDGNFLRFKTNNVNEVHIGKGTAGAVATGGELAPDVSAGGICLDQNALDTAIMTFKSSDVAHGITGVTETDTYGTISKVAAASGGTQVQGLTEDDVGVQLTAVVTNASTGKGDANSAIYFDSWIKNGTAKAAMGTNANLLGINNNGNTQFLFDAEGDLHVDGSSSLTTFDTYDDAHMVRALDLSHGRGVIDSKFDKFVKYNHEKLAELRLVGRDKNDKPNFMVNLTGMQRLHNGAIWQQYEKHNQLLEAVYDLAKEAVGEDKADAILDKHEVKRLN